MPVLAGGHQQGGAHSVVSPETPESHSMAWLCERSTVLGGEGLDFLSQFPIPRCVTLGSHIPSLVSGVLFVK